MITVAIIGVGNRGKTYGRLLNKNKDAKIVALCEKNDNFLQYYGDKFGVPKDKRFLSDKEFFASGKLADALVVSTQDRDHYGHAISGLNCGYNLLLEKPISPEISECEHINRLAEEKGLKVVVCHVMRYSPYYLKIKQLIDEGLIGDVVHINHTENVGYWHFSHSYVRGNWRRADETSPSILAKCCHDLDLIYWLTGKKCVSVASSGQLEYFTEKNKPLDAPKHCLDGCKHAKNCPYEARKIYYGLTWHTFPYMIINASLVTGVSHPTLKQLKQALATSPYGRCVFQCDNNVMEQQIVNLTLEDNVSATLNMVAFSKKCYRKFHIYGTKGEIFGNDITGKFTVNLFGKASKTYSPCRSLISIHGPCDKGTADEFVRVIEGKNTRSGVTYIADSLESHRIAYFAEQARLSGKTEVIVR